jgi:ATP-dependent exoDNAse (exonuclease V) beta subunit
MPSSKKTVAPGSGSAQLLLFNARVAETVSSFVPALTHPFKIYSSSAGSGKTYTLTKEYLKLALQHDSPTYFKQILAITFTNDAAREMKERIMGALKGFADEKSLSEKDRAGNRRLLGAILTELNEHAGRKDMLTEAELRRRAVETFANILHDYSDFAVSTIDSFVNRLVSAFTEELGVPFNYEVDLETAELLDNAVDRLLNRIGAAEEALLSQTLEEYALEKADEGHSWIGLPGDLSDFGAQLLNEKVYGAVGQLKDLDLAQFREIRDQLTAGQETLKGEVLALADEALGLIGRHGLDGSCFNGGKNGIFGYFEKIVESPERNLEKEPSATIHRAVYEGQWTAAKIKEPKRLAVEAIAAQLANYYDRIEKLKGEWMLIGSILKHFYKLSVIHEINKELARVKSEKNAVHISDFNKAIINIVLQEPVPFIYERLGEKYNHILIDEFQDTSVLQWNNLLPLVENGLAKGHFSLVVGDAKQAIYGWRGGDMEQIVFLSQKRFDDLVARHDRRHTDVLHMRYDTFRYALQLERLNTNYRSAEEIVLFNNELFLLLTEKYQANKDLLGDVYDLYAAQGVPAEPKKGGHIAIRFISRSELEESKVVPSPYQERTFAAVLETIREAQQAGYSLGDIAVLNRSNKNGKLVANFLKAQGIDVISQDSLLLQHAPAVSLVIAFLRVLHTPADALLRYEALHLFHKELFGDLPTLGGATQDSITGSNSLGPLFKYLEEKDFKLNPYQLLGLGLYELVEKLVQTFGLLSKPGQSPYLFRFLDVVLEFSTRQSNHLGDFIEYWERKKEVLCINIPVGQQAVTVTSIHKSKGLEYPVVIVPFAEWSLETGSRDIHWLSLEPDTLSYAPKLLSGMPLRAAAVSSKNLDRTPLRAQFKRVSEGVFIENLNMLYVALTRPTDRLYLLARKDDFDRPRGVSVNLLLYQYLEDRELWEPEKDVYVLEQGPPKTVKEAEPPAEATFWVDHVLASDWHEKARLRRLAAHVMDTETFEKKQDLPQKVCYALSRLESTAAVDDCLERLWLEGAVDESERADLRESLRAVLQLALVRPHFAADAAARNVRDILCRKAIHLDFILPDRVVADDKKRISLLKFLPNARNEKKREKARKDLDKYEHLLRQMGYGAVEKILVDTAACTAEVVE